MNNRNNITKINTEVDTLKWLCDTFLLLLKSCININNYYNFYKCEIEKQKKKNKLSVCNNCLKIVKNGDNNNFVIIYIEFREKKDFIVVNFELRNQNKILKRKTDFSKNTYASIEDRFKVFIFKELWDTIEILFS